MRAVVTTAIGSFSADIVTKKHRENGMRVVDCDAYPGEWIAGAENVGMFYQAPYAPDTDHYIETMLSICRKEGAKAVILLTDAEIDVFSLHCREFGKINAVLCMSDKACIGLRCSKMGLYRYLEEHVEGTTIPTMRLEDMDLDEISYPAVCKPCNGGSSQGLKFVGSCREMEGFLGEIDPAGYIVRPMIKGNVVTVDVVRSPEQGTCAIVCRKELLRTLNSVGTPVSVFRSQQLEERCRAIAGPLGVRGYVNMEFMEDQDSVYHMLECSPKPSGGMKLSCLAGCDRVTNHLHCFEGREIERDDRIKSVYTVRKYEECITKIE